MGSQVSTTFICDFCKKTEVIPKVRKDFGSFVYGFAYGDPYATVWPTGWFHGVEEAKKKWFVACQDCGPRRRG